jgi:hypothetical protein
MADIHYARNFQLIFSPGHPKVIGNSDSKPPTSIRSPFAQVQHR